MSEEEIFLQRLRSVSCDMCKARCSGCCYGQLRGSSSCEDSMAAYFEADQQSHTKDTIQSPDIWGLFEETIAESFAVASKDNNRARGFMLSSYRTTIRGENVASVDAVFSRPNEWSLAKIQEASADLAHVCSGVVARMARAREIVTPSRECKVLRVDLVEVDLLGLTPDAGHKQHQVTLSYEFSYAGHQSSLL